LWAIKLPDGGYLQDCRGAISWYKGAKATDDKNEAKHYKTEGVARGVTKGRATERRNFVKECVHRTQIMIRDGMQVPKYLERQIDELTVSADFIDKFTVVAVHVDAPSFTKNVKPKIRFKETGVGVEAKESQGNAYCKCCGIYLKKIPHLMFGEASYRKSASRICPWCMQERIEESTNLLESMDQSQREDIEAERFLHRIG